MPKRRVGRPPLVDGEARELLRADLALRYVGLGKSIRAVVADTGHSYGFVRSLLDEADVLRPHGTQAPHSHPAPDES